MKKVEHFLDGVSGHMVGYYTKQEITKEKELKEKIIRQEAESNEEEGNVEDILSQLQSL